MGVCGTIMIRTLKNLLLAVSLLYSSDMPRAKPKKRPAPPQMPVRKSARTTRLPARLEDTSSGDDTTRGVPQPSTGSSKNAKDNSTTTSSEGEFATRLQDAQQQIKNLQAQIDQIQQTKTIDMAKVTPNNQHRANTTDNLQHTETEGPPSHDEIDAPPGGSDEQNHRSILESALNHILSTDKDKTKGEDPESTLLILGATLDPKIKAKVWAGQYIDLTTMSHAEEKPMCLAINSKNSTLSLSQPRTSGPIHIYDWLRLFGTYSALYTERNPEAAPGMFTYMVRILDIQKQYGGQVWKVYDEKFRRLKASRPTLPWCEIHWNTFMFAFQPANSPNLPFQPFIPTRNNQQSQNQRPRNNATSPRSAKTPNICYDYNNKGSCTFQDACRYRHACITCHKAGHPRIRCTVKQLQNRQPSNSSQP